VLFQDGLMETQDFLHVNACRLDQAAASRYNQLPPNKGRIKRIIYFSISLSG
jgi:hypothetical protein